MKKITRKVQTQTKKDLMTGNNKIKMLQLNLPPSASV